MAHGTVDMSSYKMSLRPWLWKQIEEKKYPGLEWLDREKQQFMLPWVKQTEPDWQKYYKLFHDWDQRDQTSTVKKDDQIVKRNFRSVLNKSPHFEKIDELSEERQTGSFKVYRILKPEEIAGQKSMKQQNKARRKNESQKYISINVGTLVSPTVTPSNDEGMNFEHMNIIQNAYSPVPMNMHPSAGTYMSPESGFGDDMEVDVPVQSHKEGMSISSSLCSSDGSRLNSSLLRKKFNDADVTHADLETCILTVSYNGVKVKEEKLLEMGKGYNVLYVSDNDLDNLITVMHIDKGSNVIQLPRLEKCPPNIRKILEFAATGVRFWADLEKKSIYLKRLCQSQVFFADILTEEVQKIEQKMTTEVFSYNKLMCAMTERQFASVGGLNDGVSIVIGAKPDPGDFGDEKGVKITLRPQAMDKLLLQDYGREEKVFISAEATSTERLLRALSSSRQPET